MTTRGPPLTSGPPHTVSPTHFHSPNPPTKSRSSKATPQPPHAARAIALTPDTVNSGRCTPHSGRSTPHAPPRASPQPFTLSPSLAPEAAAPTPQKTRAPTADARREHLLAQLRLRRQKIATAATAVIEAQSHVESLRLEHASEGIDGHLMGERMLVRLAAAQARQAAAAATQAADARWEVELSCIAEDVRNRLCMDEMNGEEEGEEDAEVSAALLSPQTLLEPLEALRAQHTADRLAMHEAIEKERVGREAYEVEELRDSLATLEEAKAVLALEAAPGAITASTQQQQLVQQLSSLPPPLTTFTNTASEELRDSLDDDGCLTSPLEGALVTTLEFSNSSPPLSPPPPYIMPPAAAASSSSSCDEYVAYAEYDADEHAFVEAVEACVEAAVDERLVEERAVLSKEVAEKEAEMASALQKAQHDAVTSREQSAIQAERSRMLDQEAQRLREAALLSQERHREQRMRAAKEEAARVAAEAEVRKSRVLLAGGMLGSIAVALQKEEEEAPSNAIRYADPFQAELQKAISSRVVDDLLDDVDCEDLD